MLTGEELSEQRRKLSVLLADVQRHCGLNGTRAAAAAGRSQSWWSKVLNGRLMPTRPDLELFLSNTAVHQYREAEILGLFDELVARNDEKRVIVHHEHSRRSRRTEQRVVNARSVRDVSAHQLPDLLRTADYHRAMLSGVPESEQERSLQQLEEHQGRLRDPLRHHVFVVHEPVLLRPVGSDRVVRQQFQHLIKIVRADHRSLQIMMAPAHCPVPKGHPLSYRVYDHQLVVVRALPTGRVFLEEPQVVSRYDNDFDLLVEASIAGQPLVDFLKKRIIWARRDASDSRAEDA